MEQANIPSGWKASDSSVKRAFAKSRLVQMACGTLALIVLATIFAPLLAWQNPFDPANLDLMDAFARPWSQGMGEAFTRWARTIRVAMCSAPFFMACACRCSWVYRPWCCR